MPSDEKRKAIALKVLPSQRSIIDRAAVLSGKNRTEFILDVAYREAINVILDRRLFVLDDEAFQRFEEALNSPPKANPKLQLLLDTKAPWE